MYYYTKTLGKLLNKDEPKATQVNKINGDTNIKDVFNKVRGDMTSRPEDEKNDVFLIKVPNEKNLDDVLDKIKTLGKKLTKPETEPETHDVDYGTTEEPEVYMSDVAAASIKLADTENLVEYTSYQIQQLDYLVTALAEDHEYNANFVDDLLENDRFGNLTACLAETWEHNEDSTVWTFHLRPGVKWVTSTGEEYDEVKADDFVAGLRHGAEFASGTGWLMEGVIKYYTEYENSDFSDEEFEKVGIKALDDYTVEYTLETPTPYFDSMTTYAVLYPVNRTFLEAQGEGCKLGSPDESACSFGTTAADSILYNGGFILESYDQDSQITLVKNDNYWDAEHVYLKSVKRIYDDGSDPYSGIRSFEQGIYVAAPISAQWENFDQYMEKYSGYTTESLPNPTVFGVVFNMNREKFDLTNYADDEELRANTRAALLNDNFRKALRAAFDRSIYLQVSAPKLLADATLRNINNDPQVVRTSDGRTYRHSPTSLRKPVMTRTCRKAPIRKAHWHDRFRSDPQPISDSRSGDPRSSAGVSGFCGDLAEAAMRD